MICLLFISFLSPNKGHRMVADRSVVLGFSVTTFARAWFIQGMYILFLARRSDLGITFNSFFLFFFFFSIQKTLIIPQGAILLWSWFIYMYFS